MKIEGIDSDDLGWPEYTQRMVPLRMGWYGGILANLEPVDNDGDLFDEAISKAGDSDES